MRSSPAAKAAFPRCAALAANEKRLAAILKGQVDWEQPPFPVPNGPLFAVSRALGHLLAADLDGHVRGYVDGLERTDLGRRYLQSRQREATNGKAGRLPKEFVKRRCWPNGDSSLGLFVVRAAMRRAARVTLVNSPFGVQHYPWPVYSAGRGFSNRSIVFHGAKRNTSRAWGVAMRQGSGAFIPVNRTCGTCAAMGWVSEPASRLGRWRCCGRHLKPSKGNNRRGGGGKANKGHGGRTPSYS